MIKYIVLISTLLILGCGRSHAPTPIQKPLPTPGPTSKPTIEKPAPEKPILKKPTAKISTPPTVFIEHTLTLDAHESYDSDGNITAYRWFDDNNKTISDTASATWVAPKVRGFHTISLEVTDNSQLKDVTSVVISVQDNELLLKEITSMIKSGHATYICVGDSTRAIIPYHSEKLFYALESNLSRYDVHSFLLARSGHRIEQFNDPNESTPPTYKDVLNIIENNATSADGKDTIVDISLALNDLFQLQENNATHIKEEIKQRLETAITHITSAKPKTTILLTAPNPMYHDNDTTIYIEVYKELAQEKALAFINFYHDVYKDFNDTQKRSLYKDVEKDGTHFGEKGLMVMARYILSKILP